MYFIVCLCVIALSNLLKCWLCENVNLVLLWILRMLGTRWQCMAVFFEKNNEFNKRGKADFLQIRNFFMVEMGKASTESWAKQGSYWTAKTFSCIRWTASWFALAPKMTSQTKKPYFNPWTQLLKKVVRRVWHVENSFKSI